MKIVITIPAYNEEKTIGKVITDIKKVMNTQKYKYIIQIIDDGSRDKTAYISKKLGAKVYSHPRNLGLAEAFRTENKKALDNGADIIVHTDADGQYLASDIPKLIREVENGYDLVLGNRFKGKIEYMPFMKRIGNIAFSKAISNIIGVKVGDCQTGFRAYTKEVAKKISIISNFTYTQEQIIHTVKMKYRIKEVPVYFAKRPGKSRLFSNPFGYTARAWINVFRVYRDYEPITFFGSIGLLFFVPGILLGLYLVYLFITIGAIGRMPTVILSTLLIVVGLQIIIFGFLADMNRKQV
jgi:glycosyltransferase involved in cell wall biosynthesis